MASPVLVESMAPGSARDRIPHSHMTGKENQLDTNTGAVVKHGNGFIWHKFKNLRSWGTQTSIRVHDHRLIENQNMLCTTN